VNPRIFREYDIRGHAERDLDDAFVGDLGRAIGTHLRRAGGKTMTLGRDCRVHSPRLHRALRAGILSTGINVIDVGIVATPILYFSVFHFDADGGVQITGSHNPPDDNGFKKWTRAVDLSTGEVFESSAANQFGVVSKGIDPQLAHPSFRGSEQYYEMGFEWEPGYIRYFIVIDGSEVTLWRFTDKTLIPTLPGGWLFNLWHSNQHWYGPGGSANYPAKDAMLSLDWARYWKQ